MKRKTFYKILVILVTATFLFAACTDEGSEVRLDPTLATAQLKDLKSDSVTIVGYVVSEGEGFTEKGVCYNTATAPTIANNKVVFTQPSTSATFSVTVAGLKFATKYYARAYATGPNGTIYGEEVTFTTLPVVPMLTTSVITAITGTTATGGGNITDNGGEAVTARGVCWSTSPKPTTADSKSSDDIGEDAFTSQLTDLLGKTTYYVRAYATNKVGTAYGNEVTLTTLIAPPTVTTTVATNISGSGATAGGTVTIDGGDAITARGVCWSTTATPTINDNKTSDGTGTGVFTSTLAGLNVATLYYVRAYATNSAGTGYGDAVQFKTFPPALFMIGDGVGGWTWADIDLPMIPVNSKPNLFWKIVWMNGTGDFKFAPQKEWKDDFGKTGTAAAGIYDKGGDNIPVPGTEGYYMVVVDLATNKIAIADPKVYLMGNTIGSWDTANAAGLFTVDNANGLVTTTKTLAADELRMYAWHPWFTDWWQSEFIILGGKIAFRGTGGDQTRVSVTAGSHTINLNFKTGDGVIQ